MKVHMLEHNETLPFRPVRSKLTLPRYIQRSEQCAHRSMTRSSALQAATINADTNIKLDNVKQT